MYKLSLAGALPDQMETQPIDVMTVATPQHKDNPISPQHSAVEKRMVFQNKGDVNPNGHGHEACLETPAKPVEITHENEDRKVGDKSHEKRTTMRTTSQMRKSRHMRRRRRRMGNRRRLRQTTQKRRQLRQVRRKMESSQKVTMRPGCCLKKNMFKLEGILVLVKNHMVETMLCLFSYVAGGARRTCVHQVGPVKDSGQKARR